MPDPDRSQRRRAITLSMLAAPLWGVQLPASAAQSKRFSITDFGARADGTTVNTAAIQKTIDHAAAQGGGTVVVPGGVFVSGALFLKPKVNLHLEQGAVLRCSTDLKHFPAGRTRIEGHFAENFNPALINANGCDGLKISGAGTLDGAGRPIWDLFWKLRNAAPDPHNFKNIGIPRARLALIERSRNVTIEGVTFKDSQFWNLHLYRCQQVTVRNARFQVPEDYHQAPSSDGIDLDSCQHVLVEGCYFSVTDDCIAAKGSKGPFAMEDKDSPPVVDVRVRNCEFRRGHHMLALGSEATLVRDVLIEDCRVTGKVDSLAVFKLRPDTPQHYENIHFRNITVDSSGGQIVTIQPWTQYFDLKGAPPPKSIVRNISLVGIRGRLNAFGTIKPNPGQTTISDVLLKDFDVQLDREKLDTADVANLRLENVVVNGKPVQV
ncbi:glycoside hydrolase family 28 protein [Massilia sp. BSC265]|uniref:glycoside hydrolase family 28 protein n=1 Tax=Massilia sp. BSC265 TaxID=1549812 RepID=UPI00068A30C9|nr:glycosyl hydrolase family 28 protein [Massilia sp. BSC265]